jgi:hypothetical protein
MIENMYEMTESIDEKNVCKQFWQRSHSFCMNTSRADTIYFKGHEFIMCIDIKSINLNMIIRKPPDNII